MSHPASSSLPVWRKLGYAVGGLGDSLAFNTISFYLLYYLINVAGLPPLEAGLLAGIPRVLLIPLGAFAGPLSDRLHARGGRRRVLLLVCGPLMGAFFALQFYAPPGLDQPTVIAFWWSVQLGLSVTTTLTLVSYQAMAAELTPSSTERMQLVSLQQGFGVLGALVGPSITPLLVDVFGGAQSGFNGVGSIYGLVIALMFVTVFLTTVPAPESNNQPSSPSFWMDAASVLRQRPFILQLGVAFLVASATVSFNAAIIFYLTSVLHMDDLLPWILLVASVSSLVSIVGWNWVSRWSKRGAFSLGILIFVGSLFAMSVLPEQSPLLWLLSVSVGVGSITPAIFPKAILTDVIAADQVREGRSRAGLYTGLYGLSTRLGSSFGSALVGWLLAFIGFPTGSPQGLRWIIGFVPSVFLAAIIPCILLFRLPTLTPKPAHEA
jgi:Na+/melibiose symporter-like transporter